MSSSANVNQLLQGAHAAGSLSGKSLQALSIPDMGAKIQAGLGISVDDVPASEVTLVTVMVDDSGSIRFAGNAQTVRDGHNEVLDALDESKAKEGVLVHNRYLNGTVLYPYSPLEDAVRMDSGNYNPNLGTPLYDQAVVLLGTVLTKAEEFADAGVPVHTVTLIITDGADLHSVSAKAGTVKTLVDDLLRAEIHIVAGMGIDDGSIDFKQVFRDMGIRDEWILTPGNSPKEIRAAFRLFSQSAVRASQGAGSFSKTSMGGFGN